MCMDKELTREFECTDFYQVVSFYENKLSYTSTYNNYIYKIMFGIHYMFRLKYSHLQVFNY
jgi:hypothetical protein